MNQEYEKWLMLTREVSYLHEELLAIRGNDREIEERFYRDLAFGTAGLRGVIGAGTNRMNVFTVMRAACGVGRYLCEKDPYASVAIAYDSREKSELFAQVSAEVFAAQGITVYLYDRLMPTPMLSYAVRTLGCTGGIMVTASHNPKIYNGYKVYNDEGCQINNEDAKRIEQYIAEVVYEKVPRANYESCLERGKIAYIGQEVYEGYMSAIRKYSLSDGDIELKIVYTPLNGTGNLPVRDIMSRIGAKNVMVVPEQELPNPDFTTCPFPNPEIKEALAYAIDLAKREGGELVIATDPDCDRVGIAARDKGELKLLSGNEVGILLGYYLLSRKRENGTLPACPVIIKTIVSTTMTDAYIKDFNGEVFDVYTGFKYIGDQIKELERESRAQDLVLAFEESYGYLPGGYVRDKDAVAASMLICEMADYYHAKGQNLHEVLNELYQHYGYFKSTSTSFEFAGKEGADQMQSLVNAVRSNPIKTLAGEPVVSFKDYMTGINGLECSNVLEFSTKQVKAILRPSGTEPKLKVYIHTSGRERTECEERAARALAEFSKLLQ